VPRPDGSAVLPRRAAQRPAAEPAPCPDATVQPPAERRAPAQQMAPPGAPEPRRGRAFRQVVHSAAHSVVREADQALAARLADARLVAAPKVPLPVVSAHAEVTVRRLAARAAWGRRRVVEQVAAQDVRQAAVLQEVAPDGQLGASAAERLDVAVAERLVVQAALADAVRLPVAVSEPPWEQPSEPPLASAYRRDRALLFALAPRRSVRPRHAMQCLQIASPSARSWRAAGDEV
jgi:hypothetical protein